MSHCDQYPLTPLRKRRRLEDETDLHRVVSDQDSGRWIATP